MLLQEEEIEEIQRETGCMCFVILSSRKYMIAPIQTQQMRLFVQPATEISFVQKISKISVKLVYLHYTVE